jgi:hypothetical protein
MRESILLFSIVAIFALVGCRGPLSPEPQGYGASVRSANARMVVNPDASKNVEPVEGISPSTAEGVLENYHWNQRAINQKNRNSEDSDRISVID